MALLQDRAHGQPPLCAPSEGVRRTADAARERDDLLLGGKGRDQIFGGFGEDTIAGGLKADVLTGGTRGDVLVLSSAADSPPGEGNSDRIRDFKRGPDRIDLSAIDADGNASNGDQAFTYRGSARFSGNRGEVAYRREADEMVVAGDIDG